MTDATFAAPGRFFRGNIHTHSNQSDGALDPEEVCRRYEAEGYDFVAVTDHFVGTYGFPITDTTRFRTNRFTTILGAELHSGAMQNGELWHILAVGLPPDFERPNVPDFALSDGQETGPEIARRARDAGAFVAIAHPQWSGLTQDDARGLDAAHAVEIYNHGCVIGCDRGEAFQTLDLLLSEGRRIGLCATDDAHFIEPDSFGGWVMVKSEANDPNMLLASLKAGNYYSTQGPELHNVSWGPESVEVECSAATRIIVQGRGPAFMSVHGESLTRARVPLDRLEASPWMRMTVVDRAGKRAWTNPVWRDC